MIHYYSDNNNNKRFFEITCDECGRFARFEIENILAGHADIKASREYFASLGWKHTILPLRDICFLCDRGH